MSDPNAPLPVAAWYPDPTDPASLRWWDGLRWTPHVTSRTPQAAPAPAPAQAFTDPRYYSPPVIDESRALPTLAAAAATAASEPVPTAAPTAAPSYEPAYVPSGGYQAAYLSAHPEADLSPRPGAYQQDPQAAQAQPAALPSDIPTQYQAAQPSIARPETEPIDYPSVMDGYPQPGAVSNDPGPMAASLHANRTAPEAYQVGQQYPPQGPPVAAPAPQASATEFTASLLSQAPPPTIPALLGHQPPQPALGAAPTSPDLTRQLAVQLAAAEQLAQQNGVADKAAAYKAAADKAIADKAAFEAAATQAAAEKAAVVEQEAVAEQVERASGRRSGATTPSAPTAGQEILPEPIAQGGFTEGYQAGFRAALEGRAQVAASEKRSREVDPNAEPVPLAGLDPATQSRSHSRALDPGTDPLTAPMHRGGV